MRLSPGCAPVALSVERPPAFGSAWSPAAVSRPSNGLSSTTTAPTARGTVIPAATGSLPPYFVLSEEGIDLVAEPNRSAATEDAAALALTARSTAAACLDSPLVGAIEWAALASGFVPRVHRQMRETGYGYPLESHWRWIALRSRLALKLLYKGKR